MQALNFSGGNGDVGAARILLRAGVAALLNSASGINYPLTTQQVIDQVNAALYRLHVVPGPGLKDEAQLTKPPLPEGPLPEVDLSRFKLGGSQSSGEEQQQPSQPQQQSPRQPQQAAPAPPNSALPSVPRAQSPAAPRD